MKKGNDYLELKEMYIKLLESKLELNEKYDKLLESKNKKVKFEHSVLDTNSLMNQWIKKPIEILNKDTFLDGLAVEQIYIGTDGEKVSRIVQQDNSFTKDNSFVIILREDVLYVSPEKFILLYFERNELKSFEHEINSQQYDYLFTLYLEKDHHSIMKALNFAFIYKKWRETK